MGRIHHRHDSPVHAALARRFAPPEYALFYEVRDDAGFESTRSADAVAVALWPSRGLAIHGFEVKTSRSDFLREMKQPEKSARIQGFCDAWWLATSDPKVASAGEVPAQWGLLVLQGKRLIQAKAAPRLTPSPLDRGFVASLLRRASEHVVPKALVEEMVADGAQKLANLRMAAASREGDQAIQELARLNEQLDAFEAASGLSLRKWKEGRSNPLGDPAAFGRVVHALLDGPAGQHGLGNLEMFTKRLTEALAAVQEVASSLAQFERSRKALREGHAVSS